MSLESGIIHGNNPFPLTEDQEKILEKKMVWVLGTPRSGSTWLCRELLNLDENSVWDEPYIGKIFEQIKQIVDSKKRITNLFFHTRFKENCWVPIFRKLIITRAYHHSQNLDQNIIIKEPTGGGGADILMECIPNSKLIFLLRDGHDVVDSFLDAIKPDSWKGSRRIKEAHKESMKQHLDEYQRNRKKNIIKYSKMWDSFISTVYKTYVNHNPELRLLVKYEDLRENTFQELKRIYDFIGINMTDEEINDKIEEFKYENISDSKKGPGKKVRTAKPGGYVNNFDQDEIELMNSIMSGTLKKVGY